MAVEFKFTGDGNQLAREYDKLVSKVDKLEKKNAQLAAKAQQADAAQKRSSASAASGVASAAAGVLKWAASYASVTTAISLVNQGMEKQRRLAEESLQTQLRVAGSQAAVLKNIGDVSDDEANAFLYKLDEIRRDTQFASVVPLQQAASSILSATGGNQQLTLDILSAGAPLFGTDQDNLATFGSALGDVMKATGIKDARQNAALMLGIQGQARFEELSAFKNVAPALAAADVVTGGENETAADKLRDAREAAAAFAAIGSRAGDPDGTLTKTAAANLFANLRNVTRDAKAPAEVDTFKERLDYIRANPELQSEVLKSGFKGAIKPIIEEFISSPTSTTSQTFEDALSKIQASEEAFDRKTKQLASLTPELTTKTLGDASAGLNEDFLRTFGDAGQVRKMLEDTLPLTGGKGIQGFFSGVTDYRDLKAFDAAMAREEDPQEAAARILRAREQALTVQALPLLGGRDVPIEEIASEKMMGQINQLRDQRALLGDTKTLGTHFFERTGRMPSGASDETLAQIRDLTKRQNELLGNQKTNQQTGAARREATLPTE